MLLLLFEKIISIFYVKKKQIAHLFSLNLSQGSIMIVALGELVEHVDMTDLENLRRATSPGEMEPSPHRDEEKVDVSESQPDAGVEETRPWADRVFPGMPGPPQETDKMATVGDHNLYKKYVVDSRRAIHIRSMVWDNTAAHGQLRPPSRATVNYYLQNLLTNGPPDLPVHCYCKMTESVFLLVSIYALWFVQCDAVQE